MGEDVLPTTLEDLLNMNKKYTELDSGEKFLVSAKKLTDDGVCLIYMSDFGRRILKNSETWFMDGTFSTVPDQFSQLYVVFGAGGVHSEKIYPAAFMLLPDKSSATYQHALHVLATETNHTPLSISIDFEMAVIKASSIVFPNAVVKGCVFHWKKSLFANVGFKGCLPLFHENENFQVILDLIYALCMVPPTDVVLAWEEVIEPFAEEHLADDENVDSFLSYVERTYIGKLNPRTGGRKDPMFSVSMWSIHSRIVGDEHTTNNGVESWNARWNNAHRANHNVLRVVSGFKCEDSLARTKFQEQVAGRTINPNSGRSDRRSARVEGLKTALANYSRLNIKEFLFGLRDDV